MKDYLPVTTEDLKKRGWDQVDFVLVTGDAYVDHPSFGTAIISRLLESFGYKVAILAQPRWDSCEDFRRFGRPRLGFLINSGTVDSMVNNFSVFKNRRKRDVYAPGGKAGLRPDRAVIVYSNLARQAYRGVAVVIGGLEASLRRLGHYDYWEDRVRRSILLDSKADILIYGMGERAVMEIAEALDSGIAPEDIGWIRGTCIKGRPEEKGGSLTLQEEDILLPSFESISQNTEEGRDEYCRSFKMQYRSNDAVTGKRLIEEYNGGVWVVQNPPQPPLEREELDRLYELDYMRGYHPSYEKAGGVPAIEEVLFSVTANRGCFGGCAFCAITTHQGREVRSRSKESILREVDLMTGDSRFKGYIHDVGGPTANFRKPSCKKQLTKGMCGGKDCLYPRPCSQLEADHQEYIYLLDSIRSHPKVKKVFIRSGIRYDYLLADRKKGGEFLDRLCENHVSGILKVAPEHKSPDVLKIMRKPGIEVFDRFASLYEKKNRSLGLKQFMVPYFISSHPGSSLEDAVDLAIYMKETGFIPDQVQDFYPTPGTLSTCIYYTEKDPFTMEPVYVAKTVKEKRLQRALLHFNKEENRQKVLEALKIANRMDVADLLLGRRQERKSSRKRTGRSKGKRR